jgi:cereblon
MLGQMGDHPRLEELVSCPTALSYYIGSNMPIQDHTRQELLEIDSTLERLKREIQLLEGMDTLRCNCCGVSRFLFIYFLSLPVGFCMC